jgi:hypothetical protein
MALANIGASGAQELIRQAVARIEITSATSGLSEFQGLRRRRL